MKAQGFTLMEMLIALAISSVMLLGASRFLPLLTQENLRQLMALQLWEETQLMAFTLEKAVRRAGYCHGYCRGKGLSVPVPDCLLLRWDENSNGRWEGVTSSESDYYGYRLREGNLEMQRGVERCQGSGWEKLNDNRTVRVTAFHLQPQERALKFQLETASLRWPSLRQRVVRTVFRENEDATAAGRQPSGDGDGHSADGDPAFAGKSAAARSGLRGFGYRTAWLAAVQRRQFSPALGDPARLASAAAAMGVPE